MALLRYGLIVSAVRYLRLCWFLGLTILIIISVELTALSRRSSLSFVVLSAQDAVFLWLRGFAYFLC